MNAAKRDLKSQIELLVGEVNALPSTAPQQIGERLTVVTSRVVWTAQAAGKVVASGRKGKP